MTFVDIIDAVNELLVEHWPERAVYVDVCPVDFSRPAFWLHSARPKQTVVTPFLVRHELSLGLTLYDEQDEHYEVHASRLMADEAEVMELLLRPLQVGDRCVGLVTTLDGRAPDEAAMTITCTWFEDNPAAEDGEEHTPADTIVLGVDMGGAAPADGLPALSVRLEEEGKNGTS